MTNIRGVHVLIACYLKKGCVMSPTAVALSYVWIHGRILVPQWSCPCGQCHHQKVFKNNHMAAPVKVGKQPTTPELSWTFQYIGISGTLRNLPPEPTPSHAGTLRTPPEPSGNCLRNLYTSTHRNPPPEPSGTFLRNALLRPAPAHTGAYLGWRPH